MAAIPSLSTFRTSIVGKLAATIVSESIGAIVGAALGHYAGCALAATLPSTIVPLTILGATGYWMTTKKVSATTAAVGLMAAYMGSAVGALPNAGHFIGTIGGGFLGLRYMNRTAKFWSEKKQSCYAVASSRYELVGRFFQNLSIESSIPLVTFPLQATLKVVKVVLQNAAFQSHNLVPFLKGIFGKRPDSMKWSVAVALKELLKRYSDEAIEEQIHSALHFDATLLTAGFDTVLKNQLHESIGHAENWTAFIMRSLPKYTDSLTSQSDWQKAHRLHKEAFFTKNEALENQQFRALEQIVSSRPLSWVKGTIDPSIESIAKNLNEKIREMQVKLIGARLFKTSQEQYIQRILPLYVRGYLSYILSDCKEKGHEGQTLEEERIFFHHLCNLLIHAYIQTRFTGHWVERATSSSIGLFYALLEKVHHWIAESEQSTIVAQEPLIKQNYMEVKETPPPPPKSSEQIEAEVLAAVEQPLTSVQAEILSSTPMIEIINDYYANLPNSTFSGVR